MSIDGHSHAHALLAKALSKGTASMLAQWIVYALASYNLGRGRNTYSWNFWFRLWQRLIISILEPLNYPTASYGILARSSTRMVTHLQSSIAELCIYTDHFALRVLPVASSVACGYNIFRRFLLESRLHRSPSAWFSSLRPMGCVFCTGDLLLNEKPQS